MADDFTPSRVTTAADKDYDHKFNRTGKDLKSLEANAATQPGDTKSVKEQEINAGAPSKSLKPAPKKVPLAQRLSRSIRHKSAFGFIVGLLLLGVGYSTIFAPNIIMVNMKELFTNDLADATVALYTYDKKMLANRIGKSNCNEPDSITCKLSTMSRNEKKAFERAGFIVNGQKVQEDNLDDSNPDNDKPESRWKVSSLVFPQAAGVATDGSSFERLASSSTAMKSLVNSVFNPKTSFFMDERYKSRIKNKFDLTKNTTVYGTTEKEVNKTFDESLKGDGEKIDEAGRAGIGLYTLKTNDAKSQLSKVAKNIGEMANSYTQLQCAYYTFGKVVGNSAKTAKEHTMARFAMQYLKAADQIKSGLADEVTANVLSGKLAWGAKGGYEGKNASDGSMYTTILYDEGAKSSEFGQKYYLGVIDSIAALLPAWAQIMASATATGGIAANPGALLQPPADFASNPREYCLKGQTTASKSSLKPSQCPALAMAAATPIAGGAPAPAVAATIPAINHICPPPPQGLFLMYPAVRLNEPIITPYVADQFNAYITQYASKIARDFTSGTKGVAASDALFAGTGVILGDMAMSRGMRPADIASMTEYSLASTEVNNEIEEIARYDARKTPLDISNKYSFAGSLVRSLSVVYDKDLPFLSTATNMLAILPSSLSSLNSSANAAYFLQPNPFKADRMGQCTAAQEPEYWNIGINPDVACNVRYSMSRQELGANVGDVLNYMTKAHPNESDKSVQEIQQRLGRTDGERDAGEVSRQLSEARQGNQAEFIDKKTGKANKFTEYEKYLTYCVNREDPWGRSAMVVRRDELSEEEKQARRATKDQNGVPISDNDKGDIYETKQTASYMSITEGSSYDQDWYSGKKCLENSEMLRNFRAYTMMCSVDGSHSGGRDCTDPDRASGYSDSFYTGNDILYTSWW